MDSLDKQKQQIIGSLLKTIPENEKTLNLMANIISSDQADLVAKKWSGLCFYIAYIDNEVKYMLQAVLSDQKAFIYLDKYLALIMHEAIETLPDLYSDFFKTLREVESKDGYNRFDREQLTEGYRTYKEAIKPISSDKAFMQRLSAVRNRVAARHLDKDGNIHTLVDWYTEKRQEIGKQNNPGISSFILYVAQVSQALYPLAQSLTYAVQAKTE